MSKYTEIHLECDSENMKTRSKKTTGRTICRTISEERLSFKDGERLGDISIAIEDGKTKRKVRRILEKRVCQEYWKGRKSVITCSNGKRKPAESRGNKARAVTKRNVSRVTRTIFGRDIQGFTYVCA